MNKTQVTNTLANVKNIVAVVSGKGGVGKSTVSANLAVALARNGAKVALVDADIYGPSVPTMFDLVGECPKAIEEDGRTFLLPIEKEGIKLMSIGFFVQADKPLLWRGPMAANSLVQMFTETCWGEIDYMVVDMPPGTGDVALTLVQTLAVTGAMLVTTPQEVALADVRRAAMMFKQDGIKVPILGVIENMSYFTPAELPDNKYYIFGKGGGERFAKEIDARLLGQIPIVQSICESGDTGRPFTTDSDSIVAKAFNEIAMSVVDQVSLRNMVLNPTEKVNVSCKTTDCDHDCGSCKI